MKTTYARIVGGIAVDVISDNPIGLFHADLVPEFIVVPEGTEAGDLRADDGTWSKPNATPAPGGSPMYAMLTPMTFYMAFTPAERIKIKKSTDSTVEEFWYTFNLSVQLQKPTDPNLPSVADGLQYLVSVGILTDDRVESIKLGIPQ